MKCCGQSNEYKYFKKIIMIYHVFIVFFVFNHPVIISISISRPGPSCSKLTTSLVNVSLKFQMLISEIPQYSQTCLKGSPKGRTKSGCLRQVTP